MKENNTTTANTQSATKSFKALTILLIMVFATHATTAIDSQEQRLNQVEKEILAIDRWFAKQKKLKQDWSSELKKADLDVQQLKRKILVTATKLNSSNDLLVELETERSNLEAKRVKLSDSLSKHVRSAYKLQKSSPLKRLLEGESIDQFDQMMRFNRYLTSATKKLLEDYQKSLADIESSDKLAQATNEQIRESIKQNKRSVRLLRQKITKRKALIDELEVQQKDKKLEYRDLVAERESLEQLISELLVAESPQNIEPFLGSRNSLPTPIKGKISKKFGGKEEQDTLISQGLDILAPVGTPVHAISPGQIVFSDWLRGFGLIIIIDHGDDYMSLYANTEVLYKKQGEFVESGELIAEAGNSGGRKEPGIHFEIRHRGRPIDPEPWIKNQ